MARPKPKLTPKQMDELENMAALGLTVGQMAALLDISERTLERLSEDNEPIRGAIERGRAKAIFQVSKSAFAQAVSGKVPAMTMFYLKCRARWKETHAIEHSGPDGKPIETKDLSSLTDEQIAARIKQLTDKNGEK